MWSILQRPLHQQQDHRQHSKVLQNRSMQHKDQMQKWEEHTHSKGHLGEISLSQELEDTEYQRSKY